MTMGVRLWNPATGVQVQDKKKDISIELQGVKKRDEQKVIGIGLQQ